MDIIVRIALNNNPGVFAANAQNSSTGPRERLFTPN